MDRIYPAGPASVPPNLTAPTTAYKQRAWVALAGLALFVGLYLFLSGWFAWTSWRLISGAIEGGKSGFMGWILGACAAFLAVFMVKALVFIKRGGESDETEITAQQQPELFAFLYRLADEAGAPRPHRVFLSPRVNAAVFYDLSILNLVFPSKKNLEIGLGLVNVLTLGEFKAVIAHEFGHFAQRSMAVGSWVYIGQQIAAHIVAKRDVLDRFLQGLSNIDLRIAWVGWILRVIVWSIRSLVETVFNGVVMAQRALSRQMEMQADLVAVSLTGSDALIHALARMNVADEAWSRAIAFANTELRKNRAIVDIFAIQSRAIFHFADVFDDKAYGNPPPVPFANPEKHRVFKAAMAQPPQMWSSHPLNHEREENAKRVYVAAPLDTQSAWVLFKDPLAVREKTTAEMVPAEGNTPAATIDALVNFDKEYDREFYKRAYRGAYLGRSVVRNAARAEDLYTQASASDLSTLYPASLTADLEQWRNLEQEKSTLENLRSGVLKAPEGVIRHRGKVLVPKDLPLAITEVEKEMAQVEARVGEHDLRCRSAHRAAAATVRHGWEAHLVGIASVLHYADHTEANLYDADRKLSNTVHVVLAAGRPNKTGVNRVIADAKALFLVLKEIYDKRGLVELDGVLLASLDITSWADALGDFGLLEPHVDNINEWLKAVEGWVRVTGAELSRLQQAALEQLLISETRVAGMVKVRRVGEMAEGREAESAIAEAPSPPCAPERYPVLVRGNERKLETKLSWWARFQNSIGIGPTIARLAVALGIIGTVLGFGGSVGVATVTIYNGLSLPAQVKFGAVSVLVTPASSTQIEVAPNNHYAVETRAKDGRVIESFDADVSAAFGNYVYNVAGGSPLVEWQVVYGGSGAPRPDKVLGAPRWTTTSADVLFAEPPKSIRSKSGGATRDVLVGFGNMSPETMLNQLPAEAERARLIDLHARWDGASSRYLMYWLAAAEPSKAFPEILASRIKGNPNDIAALRFEQEAADPAAKLAVCARHRSLAEAAPQNGSLKYLAARCTVDRVARDQAFLDAYQAAPKDGWTAYAAGYVLAEQTRWPDALSAFEVARRADPVVAGMAMVDLARVRRMMAVDGRGDLTDLAKESDAVRNFMAFERGEMMADAYAKAFTEMSKGKIPSAVELGKFANEKSSRLMVFSAASDGADPVLVEKVLALPPEVLLDRSSVWIALALATRQKVDQTSYRAALDSLVKRQIGEEDAKVMMPVLEKLRVGAAVADVENSMNGLRPELRGQAYAMGLIIRGKSAPPKWRDGAKRLLFAIERPYFG
jgi:Zn-dependent protease with chaperone function